MTKQKVKQAAKNIFGGLSAFLPIIILILGVFFLVQYFKNSGGLLSAVKRAFGLGGENETEKKTGTEALGLIENALKAKNLKANALHIAQANTLFDLINSKPSNNIFLLFDTGLSEEISKEIYDIYNGVAWTADDALIYSSYGRRKANNRVVPLLGLIYDDTTGDLRKHAEKYLHSAYKTKMVALIDRAIKAYLI